MPLKINKYLTTARFWQWSKNIVVFTLPIGIGTLDYQIILSVFISFLGISLISSGTYVLNDIRDVNIDKNHPIKKNRPIASNNISIKNAKIFFAILLVLGFITLASINILTFFFGFIYFLGGVVYTYKVKFIPYLDIIIISLLFLIRVLIGSSAILIQPSIFLLSCIFFSSACLALSKRITIYLNDEISSESKYKKFLLDSYEISKLSKFYFLSSIFSLLTYVFWILLVKVENAAALTSFFLLLSTLVAARVFYGIYKLSITSGLEDFVLSIIKNKKETIYIFLMVIFVMVGIYG